jgi:hypothetical protein
MGTDLVNSNHGLHLAVEFLQARTSKVLAECTQNDLQISLNGLEPLAEVQRALLVVEVLHLPHPELGGLLSGGNGLEHSCGTEKCE